MIDEYEIYEAENETEDALALIDDILRDIRSAKNWGFLDLLGGGFFVSIFKREKIHKINTKLISLGKQLVRVRKELSDVEMNVDLQLPDSFADNFFDIAFDNIFTDFSTQRMLGEAERKLLRIEATLQTLLRLLREADYPQAENL